MVRTKFVALAAIGIASAVQAADPSAGEPTWARYPKIICRAERMTNCEQSGCKSDLPTAIVVIDFVEGTVRPIALKVPYRVVYREYKTSAFGHAWATRILDSTGEVWTFDDPKAGIGDNPEIAAVSARTGFGSSLTYWSTCSPA